MLNYLFDICNFLKILVNIYDTEENIKSWSSWMLWFSSTDVVWFVNSKFILAIWKIRIDLFNMSVIMRRNEKHRGDVTKGD